VLAIFTLLGSHEQASDSSALPETYVEPAARRGFYARLANQKHSRHSLAMMRFRWLVCFVCGACSAGSDTSSERHAFEDGAGRACEAALEKTSSSAASLSVAVSCDGDGKQCSKEAKPCFQLNVDDLNQGLYNCPACCRGSASSFVAADCSALVCETDADCVYSRARCLGGACSCPNGICE
jgi:hypothetical protein